MFNQLIESGSHRKDKRRKLRFFLGTLGCYGLLLLLAGVASVYAYDTHLGHQDFEITLVTPVPLAQIEPRPVALLPHRVAPGSTGSAGDTLRRVIIADTRSHFIPDGISTHPATHQPSPPGAKWSDRDAGMGIAIGPSGHTAGSDGSSREEVRVPVRSDDVPPPPPVQPRPTPSPVPDKVRLPSSVITSKIITKPAPVYPVLAKQARVQGTVTVEITIDEQGRVVFAQATSGHPLLRPAAQQSAYQARFSPTTISGQHVKVSGIITYNFVLQ